MHWYTKAECGSYNEREVHSHCHTVKEQLEEGGKCKNMNSGSHERNCVLENMPWRLKEVTRSAEYEICPLYSKDENWNLLLRCEETKIWRDKILVKRFRNINTETGIRRIVGCKNKEQW
jgi:hypothetical protein